MNTKQKSYLKLGIFSAIGALAGYSYYFFIGCKSGTCPLTSNWEVTTLYGLVSGLVIGFPTKKKEKV